MKRRWSALALALVLGFGTPIEAAPVPVEKPSALRDAEFEKLWNNIDSYQPSAVKFWCRMQADPKAGYAFLDRKIEPIQLNEATAKRLIDDLGSDDESTWKAAAARLKVRDIRLAMNFLDAWEHAKTDLKRKRLLPLVLDNGYMDNLGFYDVTFTQMNQGPGMPLGYNIQTALRPDVSKDAQLALKLHGGFGMGFGVESLTTPDERKTYPENALAHYLDGHLLARLAQGDPNAEPAKGLLESAKAKRIQIRSLGGSLTAGQLPTLWDQWCTNTGAPDRLTKEMLLNPGVTVAFLKREMKPVRADALRVGLLLSLLGHPSDEVWDRASMELNHSDPRFCFPTETLWQLARTCEQRRRLAIILCPDIPKEKCFDYRLARYKTHKADWVSVRYWVRKDLSPEEIPAQWQGHTESSQSFSETPKDISRAKWNREEAAIWVLEAIGTEPAFAIVERMATGHPDAGPTLAAKEVLARRIRN